MKNKKKISGIVKDFILIFFLTIFEIAAVSIGLGLKSFCFYDIDSSLKFQLLPKATQFLLDLSYSKYFFLIPLTIIIVNIVLFILFITKLKEKTKIYIIIFMIVIFLIILLNFLIISLLPYLCL